ncbi:MAG: prenyltransferase/squalene oxidase repeat-containing protein [Thermoleophilia bacterium]
MGAARPGGHRTEAAAQAAPALQALRARQHADGGWAAVTGSVSDTAATAAAVQALAAWGEPAGAPAMTLARGWLLAARRPDGGFAPLATGRSTSVDSAWAALALWAMGESPRSRPWARAGRSPLGLIADRQRADGGVADTRGAPSSTFATTLAVLALRGRPLPVGPGATGAAAVRAPVVVRRSPAPGDPPGPLVVVRYRDDPGGTGIDPAAVRLVVGGADLTRAARISPFGLQVPAVVLPALPAVLELRLADRAGNRRTERWVLGGARTASTGVPRGR